MDGPSSSPRTSKGEERLRPDQVNEEAAEYLSIEWWCGTGLDSELAIGFNVLSLRVVGFVNPGLTTLRLELSPNSLAHDLAFLTGLIAQLPTF
jgi:hypothetical protein